MTKKNNQNNNRNVKIWAKDTANELLLNLKINRNHHRCMPINNMRIELVKQMCSDTIISKQQQQQQRQESKNKIKNK